MAKKINPEKSVFKKLLPEIPPETHEKVSTFLKEHYKINEKVKPEEHASITLVTTNIAFILYEHVELRKGVGGYAREDAISLPGLRDFMMAKMENGARIYSIIFSVLDNCFDTDMLKQEDNYYRFIHPEVEGSIYYPKGPIVYPGCPTKRWNKHIWH